MSLFFMMYYLPGKVVLIINFKKIPSINADPGRTEPQNVDFTFLPCIRYVEFTAVF